MDEIIRHINLFFAAATLPASLLLVKNFVQNGSHDKWVKALLITMFGGISVAMMMTIMINIQLLFLNYTAQDVLFEANVRNLIKNLSLFLISWGFLLISSNTRR